MKKIGLSLSFCIKDIIKGNVDVRDVKEIICGTQCKTAVDWERVIGTYSELYWKENPIEAQRIFSLMKKFGKIKQPRLEGGEAPNISEGWWVNADEEI